MPAYVGIDPSVTNSGLVVIEGAKATDYSIKSKPTNGYWADRVRRYEENAKAIRNVILGLAPLHHISVFVEDYAIGRFAGSNIATIEMGAHLRLMLFDLTVLMPGLGVHFIKPAVVKQFAAGKGNATKMDVAINLVKRFGVDFGSDDNLYDAYALARMAYASGGNIENLTKQQIVVVDKLNKKEAAK